MPRTLTRNRTDYVSPDAGESNSSYESDDTPVSTRASRRGLTRDAGESVRGRGRTAEATDEAPSRSDRRSAQAGPHASGWAGHEKIKSQASKFPEDFKISDEKKLIKFLDSEPFVSYLQHWIDEAPNRKSFNCLGDECPLCEVGDNPAPRSCFNIVDLEDPQHPQVRVLTCGPQLAGQLKNFAMDPRGGTSPLNHDDLYWGISKSGGGRKGKVTYNLMPVKARDLENDWDTAPLTDAELDDMDKDRYGADDVVRYDSRKFLEDLLDSLDG